MTLLLLRLVGGLCLAGLALAQSSNAVQRLVLNPYAAVRVPVSLDRLTTVRFPSPLSDLEGAFVATEPHPDARFLLSFRSGAEFFSLRALIRRATAGVHVCWNRQTYVLDVFESDNPWSSVIFELPATNAARSRPTVTPSRLLGLLDTAKAYPLLKQQHPQAVANVECVRSGTAHDYGDYQIRTEEVLRFDAEDALVFRIALSNKTDYPIRYLPQSLMVRAGERVLYQSITDASGLMPPRVEVPVYFAVASTPDGSRHDISPRNEFMVLLSRLTAPAAARPSASIPAVRRMATDNPQVPPPVVPVPRTASLARPRPDFGSLTAIPNRYRSVQRPTAATPRIITTPWRGEANSPATSPPPAAPSASRGLRRYPRRKPLLGVSIAIAL